MAVIRRGRVRAAVGAGLGMLLLGAVLGGCASRTPAADPLEDLFSTADQRESLAACLADAGWPARLDEKTGAVVTEVPANQRDAYDAATRECSEAAGIGSEAPLTAEQYAVTYEWYSEIAACIEAAGWSVPPRPTLAAFTASYDTEPWIPWADVPADENAAALDACPVMVPPGTP